MKNGWMWQAPLQNRWGCGYVFNDTYITNEEAKKEVEDYLGKEIKIVKKKRPFGSLFYLNQILINS